MANVRNTGGTSNVTLGEELDIRWVLGPLHWFISYAIMSKVSAEGEETGSVENKLRPGGPSKLTSRAKRMIVRSATNKPMPSAQNIVNELLSSCNVSVSAQTVRNGLHSAGLKARELPERNLILVK
ncbi:paired domain-containing protein [Trichonephila clavipes]|nr:paired domain-containing protein [Trichonephila clavipes]